MDKTVTAKFFQIRAGRGSNGHPLIEHLRSLNASQPNDRIRLVNDVPHWVDKVEVSAAVASGRFCRKQSTNLPPKALDRAELVPLGIKEIGQTVAWRYDSKLSVLAIETSRSGLSVARLLSYVRMICDCRGYGAFPVVTDTNLELAREGRVRELSLQLATPRDLQSVAPYQQAVSNGMNTLMSQNLSSMLEIRYSLRVGEPDIPFTRFERMVRGSKVSTITREGISRKSKRG